MDLIERQKAIDALADMHCKSDEDGYVWIIRSDAWARIDALPSVTPKRKKGKWRDHQEGDWIYAKCSLCGAVQDSRSNFCPNCGAEMEGEEESK